MDAKTFELLYTLAIVLAMPVAVWKVLFSSEAYHRGIKRNLSRISVEHWDAIEREREAMGLTWLGVHQRWRIYLDIWWKDLDQEQRTSLEARAEKKGSRDLETMWRISTGSWIKMYTFI